jgi:hypothetical protein
MVARSAERSPEKFLQLSEVNPRRERYYLFRASPLGVERIQPSDLPSGSITKERKRYSQQSSPLKNIFHFISHSLLHPCKYQVDWGECCTVDEERAGLIGGKIHRDDLVREYRFCLAI